jgi:hypothetical protein
MFGGSVIEAVYTMKHTKNQRVNVYTITCRVSGFEVHDLELFPETAEFDGDPEKDTNDETLTNDGALALFEDNL